MAIFKGDSKNNRLNGGTSSDSLFGFRGNDLLNGRGGHDTLDGGTGSDTLSGGASNDTYIVDNIGDIVIENVNGGTDTVKSSVNFTLPANVEKLVLTGTSALDGMGNSSNNTLTGNAAANKLVGNAGDDTLYGDTGVDSLYGGAGNDLLKINELNGDVIDGGLGRKDVLEISGANQSIDLTDAATSITGIETIAFSGRGNNRLTLNAQSIIDLGNSSNTLIVDGDAGDTLHLDNVGWNDGGVQDGYDVFTLLGATVKVNKVITVESPPSYTISDATTAAQVSGFFTDGIDEVVIDFGGRAYRNYGLPGGEIDLTGFGLEDTLAIAQHDGLLNYGTAAYGSARSSYIVETQGQSILTILGGYYTTTAIDRVSWQKSASTAKLVSSYKSSIQSIQITGLPVGLADSQFIFM